MANDVTSLEAIIPMLALAELRENAILPNLVNSMSSNEMAAKGKKVKINLTAPQIIHTVVPGTDSTAQDIENQEIEIDVTTHYKGSKFKLSEVDFATIDQGIVPNKVKEAVRVLANDIEIKALGEMVNDLGGIYGTNDAPNDTTDIQKTRLRLDRQLAPMQGRVFLIDPDTYSEFSVNTTLASADTTNESRPTIVSGFLGTRNGFDFHMSQNIATQNSLSVTSGTAGTNATLGNNQAVVNGALAKGKLTMNLDGAGLASGTIKKGQKFKFAGLDQEFTLSADATFSSNAATGVTFLPMLQHAIADDTTVTFYRTFTLNGVAFTKDVMTIAYLDFMPLDSGLGVVVEEAQDEITGAKMRLLKQYKNYEVTYELQVCYGVKVVQGAYGTILGTFSGAGTSPIASA